MGTKSKKQKDSGFGAFANKHGATIHQKPKKVVSAGDFAPMVLKDNIYGGTAVSFGVEDDVTDKPLDREVELSADLLDAVDHDGVPVNELCSRYGLKREELGRLTGFSLRALAEWATGKIPSAPAKRRLQEVERLLSALEEIIDRKAVSKWLHTPNRALNGMTPLHVIELGHIDRLWSMVHDFSSGAAT